MIRKRRVSGSTEKDTAPQRKKSDLWFYILIGLALVIIGLGYLRQLGYLPLGIDSRPSPLIGEMDPALREERAAFKIINAHEHVQSSRNLPLLLQVMEDCQLEKIILLGTPEYTFYLNPKYGFTEYDKNNQEIISLSKQYPDKFIALCTLNPHDEDKLEKLKNFMAAGAKGLKLYNGHGYFYDNFFELPLDDPGMMEVYSYCEEKGIPILYHVNSGRFLQQFENILQNFPDLTIIAPHFILTSSNLSRLSRLLDTYPNLYTDISFGHPDFQVAGFKRISQNNEAFRAFMRKYRERIMFGTDIVITSYRAKSRSYIEEVILSYFDLLEKEEFLLPDSIYKMMSKSARANTDPETVYRGLHLDEDTLRMIYHDNAERVFGR